MLKGIKSKIKIPKMVQNTTTLSREMDAMIVMISIQRNDLKLVFFCSSELNCIVNVQIAPPVPDLHQK